MTIRNLDPSRTTMLRRRFEAEMTRRFKLIRSQVINFILNKPQPWLIHNALEYSPGYASDSQKLALFKAWLKSLIDGGILRDRANWLDQYIQDGYRKGLARSFEDVRPSFKFTKLNKRLDFYNGTKAEFLSSSFMRPVNRHRVELLATRTYTELQGVTDAVSQQLARVLADGMIQGQSPRDVALNISKSIQKIGIVRATNIARTETIRAHAEGQLDALSDLGVTHVGVAVEWDTAGDAKVCKLCRPLDGMVLTVDEARGMLPRHPSCRCAWVPANVGEDHSNQLRTKSRITAALKASYGKPKLSVSYRRPKQIF